MKFLSSTLFTILFFSAQSQNASFGVGASAFELDNDIGLYMTANVRAQLTDRFGWSTEVGFARIDEHLSRTITRQVLTIKTGLTTKLLSTGGLNVEAITSAGGIVNDKDWFGLLSGELFFSAQISKNLVAGLPIGYHFITWERDSFVTAGFSLRFHM